MSGHDHMHPIADRWGRVRNFDFCAEVEPATTWPHMLWIQPSTGLAQVRNASDTDWISLAGSTDHGALTGLADDDHPHYLRADGSRALSGAWDVGAHQVSFGAGISFNGTSGENDIIIRDNIATALQVVDAGGWEYARINSEDTNPYICLDPGNVGINVCLGKATAEKRFDIQIRGHGDGIRLFGGGSYVPAVMIGIDSANVNDRNWAVIGGHTAWGMLEIWVSNAPQGDPYLAGSSVVRIDRTGQVGIGCTPSTRLDIDAGAIEFREMTSPAAGAANTCRVYCIDTGGKTQLLARFATGAEQQLAIEP